MDTLRLAVAVDFSPESDLAVGQALELARASGGEVVLFHAVDWLDGVPAISLRPELARAIEARREHVAAAHGQDRQRLADLREALTRQGARVAQSVLEGPPDLVVPRAAHEVGADLLVLGTHGRTGLRWFFLGSAAERMIRSSRVDVLVARGVARGGFHRILVATDFSVPSVRALDRALALAADDAQIDVVHFYPSSELGYQPAVADPADEALVAELQAAGDMLVAEDPVRGRRPRFSIVSQPPIPGIVHRLESQPYDLVALGSHGRRGISRFLLGSVAEAVARRAPCSVLIARPHEGTAP